MGKIAVMFPGQGAQSVGMGREYFEASAQVRKRYDQASQILGYDIAALCFDGPEQKLSMTEYCQPAIFLTSFVAFEYLCETAPETVEQFQVAAGLSLGEYTALACAGALSFEEGLQLVHARGMAMQNAANRLPCAMVSVLGLDAPTVESLCEAAAKAVSCEGNPLSEQELSELYLVQIANYLCPANYTVSGTRAACEKLAQLATAAGAMKVVMLPVSGGFHTKLMEPAMSTLATVLEKTEISTPKIPVISNVDFCSHCEPDDIRKILLQQLCSPVRWEESMQKLLEQGFDSFYEIGPGRILRGLMKRINRKATMNT